MTDKNKNNIESPTNEGPETPIKIITQFSLSTHILKKSAEELGLTAVQKSILATMSAAAPVSRMSVKTISERSGYGITAVKSAKKKFLERDILVFHTESKKNVACQYLFNLQALGYSGDTQLKGPPHAHFQRRLKLQIESRDKSVVVNDTKKMTASERKELNIKKAMADGGLSIPELTAKKERDITPIVLDNCNPCEALPELDCANTQYS